MNLSEGRLAPVPGVAGLVTRTPGAVLFVAARTPSEEVARLTGLVAAADGPQPARALARELASLVAGDADGTLPGFALVADSAGGTYVRVYGDVEVRLSGPAGDEVLTGVGSFTGSDREVAGELHTITAVPAGAAAPDLVAEVDVRGGTSLGDGFSLTTTAGAPSPIAAAPAPAPAAAPAPAPAPAPVAAAAPVEEAAMAAAPVAEPPPEPAPEPEPAPPADEAAAVAAVSVSSGTPPVEEQTQAWTPSTSDFERDDVDAAVAAAEPAEPAPPAAAPAWGSAEPDVPALPVIPPSNAPDAPPAAAAPLPVIPPSNAPDAPSTYQAPSLDKPAEVPGTPTPVPESAPVAAAPAPAEPVAWDDLPVVDAAPPAHEPATVAVAPEATAEAAAPAPAGEFSSQLLGALDDDEAEAREPLPVETDPAEVRQPEQVTSEVRVQGVICSRGHFNDPRSRFCSSCGISMVQNTQVLTQGPRPPLGVMVFEDGATFSLSSDYVVGRQPEVSELVQQGLALPLPVDDPERSISRAHAELRLVDWDVHLVNLSGTNGSFVWDENGQQWVPIPEGQSVVLTPGMRVALGRRSAVFESSLVR